MSSVLISGASIAGPALAYWLEKRGFTTTIVERTPDLRPGGQAIDIRGAALDVVDRMGLLPAVQEKRTRISGVSMLDTQGKELWRSEERTLSAGRLDSADVEILRDDLTEILFEATKAKTEYIFDDTITAIEDEGDAVAVIFKRGSKRNFDFVIGADGLYSTTRDLAFGLTDQFVHHLGSYIAIFTTENILGLKDWQMAMWGETSGALIYPARSNTELRVFVGFESEPLPRGLSQKQQQAVVLEQAKELGWEVPRLLAAMESSPAFYMGEMAQVRMPRWSKGRVTLVGDAGYCPSPKSGQGTSLALVGAYILADELGRDPDEYDQRFKRYEDRMRPFIALNQALALRKRDERPSDEDVDRAKNAIVLDA